MAPLPPAACERATTSEGASAQFAGPVPSSLPPPARGSASGWGSPLVLGLAWGCQLSGLACSLGIVLQVPL